jgi:hypothetical protein
MYFPVGTFRTVPVPVSDENSVILGPEPEPHKNDAPLRNTELTEEIQRTKNPSILEIVFRIRPKSFATTRSGFGSATLPKAVFVF